MLILLQPVYRYGRGRCKHSHPHPQTGRYLQTKRNVRLNYYHRCSKRHCSYGSTSNAMHVRPQRVEQQKPTQIRIQTIRKSIFVSFCLLFFLFPFPFQLLCIVQCNSSSNSCERTNKHTEKAGFECDIAATKAWFAPAASHCSCVTRLRKVSTLKFAPTVALLRQGSQPSAQASAGAAQSPSLSPHG